MAANFYYQRIALHNDLSSTLAVNGSQTREANHTTMFPKLFIVYDWTVVRKIRDFKIYIMWLGMFFCALCKIHLCVYSYWF